MKIFAMCLLGFAASFAPADNPVHEKMAQLVKDGEVPGCVTLVADKDKIIDFAAFGYANIEKSIPMDTNSFFWVASQTKTLTTALFMMLVDEGKVSLDDPVSKFIPGFENMVVQDKAGNRVKAQTPITMRMLLSHSSGMPPRSPTVPMLDRYNLERKMVEFLKTPLDSEPGTKYRYSNCGIDTAARVVELIEKRPYEELLQERILTPLGMMDTTFIPDKAQIARLASVYKSDETKTQFVETKFGAFTYPLDTPTRAALPSGGIFSSAADMVKFCQMLLNKGVYGGRRYLSAESVEEMAKRQAVEGAPYGLGTMLGNGWFGHAGASGTKMCIYPEEGIITVFMIQRSGDFTFSRDQVVDIFNAAAFELLKK